MAIILEEEKKPVNWMNIAIAGVVVVVIFVGAYFIFFKQPQFIEVVAPTGLREINTISQLSFDPQALVGSPVFKSLKSYATASTPPAVTGRANPFAPVQ